MRERVLFWSALVGILAVALITSAASTAPAPARTPARTVTVAAAANLRYALHDIAKRFEAERGVRLQLVFGSSGLLAAQIEQGAPFDIFFSADEAFVSRLAASGAVAGDTVRVYAVGGIALWLRADSPIRSAAWTEAVVDPRVRYLGIANPAHAPYGRAAEEALRAAGLRARVASKIVLSDNVDHVLQLVRTGNADAGIIAASLAVAPPVIGTGRYLPIPATLHRPIRQALGIVSRAPERLAADALVAFVTAPAGRAVFRRHGFGVPDEP